MKRIRVNVLSVINSASNITTEIIDGKEHIVVKDVCPVVDNIVLNSGLYPTEEINKGYKSLEGKPMPYGHPMIDGKHVSASNVRAVNEYHIGAYARNVRKDGERVLMDMCVNRAYAESSDKGKELIQRLDDMKAGKDVQPIGVSTGLDLNKITANGQSKGKRYSWIATNQSYDHCAILLHEKPAGTPAEGVGIFVNSDGEESEIETVNLSDAANLTQEGIINKAKFFFSANSQLSFDDIYQLINNKLNPAGQQKYVWVESVYPSTFIYKDGDQRFKQQYLIDENQTVNFVGDRVEVVKTVEYDEIKTNGDKNPMKEMIVNALKAKGKPTEGKTEAELLDAYNQMNAEEAKTKTETPEEKAAREKKEADEKAAKDAATNSDLGAMVKAAVAEALAPTMAQLTANADKERSVKREAVKAHLKIDDLAVNAMGDAALDAVYAQTQKSIGLNGQFQQNSAENSICTMPE